MNHVVIYITFLDDSYKRIIVRQQIGQNYATAQETIFTNGFLVSDGWFTAQGIDNVFHAIPITQIKSITCEVVVINE